MIPIVDRDKLKSIRVVLDPHDAGTGVRGPLWIVPTEPIVPDPRFGEPAGNFGFEGADRHEAKYCGGDARGIDRSVLRNLEMSADPVVGCRAGHRDENRHGSNQDDDSSRSPQSSVAHRSPFDARAQRPG